MKANFGQLAVVALAILSGCYTGSRPKGIGHTAPDFTVQDSERKISLGQFRGQIVVLNFPAAHDFPPLRQHALPVAQDETEGL